MLSQTRQVSHLKHWEGTAEDGTGWRFNRHRDSLDITDEELSNSIVSSWRNTSGSGRICLHTRRSFKLKTLCYFIVFINTLRNLTQLNAVELNMS